MIAIVVRPVKDPIYTGGGRQAPAFEVVLAGLFPESDFHGGNVELKLAVRDGDPDGNVHQVPDAVIATIRGTLKRISTKKKEAKFYHFTLTGVQSAEAKGWGDAQSGLDDANDPSPFAGFAFSDDTSPGAIKWFALPKARPVFQFGAEPDPPPKYFEGDTWELELRLTVPDDAGAVVSPSFPVAWNPRVVPYRGVQQPVASYDWHPGNDVLFYNDANVDQAGAAGYFHDVEQAIEAAKSVVLIVDWSFHPVTRLTPGDVTLGNCLGARLIRKANAGVTVAILTWYHGMAPKEPPNDNCQTIMNAIAADLGLGANKVLWRGAVRKGVGWSHHQKFVLVDDGTEAPAGRARLKVYFGGIDLTQGRSDWGDHHILREDNACANLLRTLQNGGNAWGAAGPYDDWYNAEFTSSDYGLPAPDAPKPVVGAQMIDGDLILGVVSHGFAPGDVIRIDGSPAIDGDRVVDEAPDNPLTPKKHWFRVTTLDGFPVAANGNYEGNATVTRNAPRFPRQPWHDVHARLDGPIAWDFAREFMGRWMMVIWPPSGDSGNTSGADNTKIWDAFYALFDRQKFVQQWEDHVRANDEKPPLGDALPGAGGRNPIFSGQLLHSFQQVHLGWPKVNDRWHPGRKEMKWLLSGSYERSIQDSYLKAIVQAERFIYIENQYFIGSGSKLSPVRKGVLNRIPEALVSRILAMKQAGRPFHVYVIMPQIPEGPAVFGKVNPLPAVRNLEWRTIAYMASAIGQDWQQYLSFYFLQRNDLGAYEGPYAPNPAISNEAIRRTAHVVRNQRYMIYVHCKLMIVDDRYLILGSANINERSMAGDRDSEICVALWPQSSRTAAACEDTIRGLREALLREHLGEAPPGSFAQPHRAAFRHFFQARGQENYRRLLAPSPHLGAENRLRGHLVMFPFEMDASRDWRRPVWTGNEAVGLAQYIVDSINSGEDESDVDEVADFDAGYWTWQSGVPWCCSALPNGIIE